MVAIVSILFIALTLRLLLVVLYIRLEQVLLILAMDMTSIPTLTCMFLWAVARSIHLLTNGDTSTR
jgi:hypothetical protein